MLVGWLAVSADSKERTIVRDETQAAGANPAGPKQRSHGFSIKLLIAYGFVIVTKSRFESHCYVVLHGTAARRL
jgi:hypothetical protein